MVLQISDAFVIECGNGTILFKSHEIYFILRIQYVLLSAADYVVKFRFERVSFREVLDHLRCCTCISFTRMSSATCLFFSVKAFSFIRSIDVHST